MSTTIVDLEGPRIQTTVTIETSEFNRPVKTFLSNKRNTKKIIGLDTERARHACRETKTVLLQLSDGDYCLIVQLSAYYRDLPLSLFNFLNLPGFTFVGIGINKSLKMLESEFGLTCKNAVEVVPPKLNKLTYEMSRLEIVMGDIVQKEPASPVFDDWGSSALNENQIKLAVSNAYFAFGLGNILRY